MSTKERKTKNKTMKAEQIKQSYEAVSTIFHEKLTRL